MSFPIDQIATSYKHLYASRYTQLSSLALLVWDYFLTLPDESRLFWHGRWTYPRALFFLNRYQVIIIQGFNTFALFNETNSTEFCQAWGHYFLEATGIATVFCIHLILALRIYGLYGRGRWITVFLAIMLLGTLVGEIYTAAALAPNFTRIPLPIMINQFVCLPSETTNGSLFFVPAIAFDFLALLLVVVRCLSHMRAMRVAGFRGSNLIRIVLRDSVLHFAIILAFYIIIAINWITSAIEDRFLLYGYAASAISMTATRLLMNLKHEALHSSLSNGSNMSTGGNFRLEHIKHIRIPFASDTIRT